MISGAENQIDFLASAETGLAGAAPSGASIAPKNSMTSVSSQDCFQIHKPFMCPQWLPCLVSTKAAWELLLHCSEGMALHK